MLTGMVYESGGGVYRVALDMDPAAGAVSGSGPGPRAAEVVEASLRGRLKLEARSGDKVVVGDRVRVVAAADGGFTIEEVLPRESELVRRGGGGGRRGKILAANVDRMLVVTAGENPAPRPALIDRLLVIGEANELECVLVINKLDLPGARERAEPLCELYRRAGYRVIETSSVEGEGLDELAEVLCSGISVLAGPSGAGKSSLLNALEPGLGLRIGELSRKRGTGRHTTVRSRLIPLACGGLVADTPGFADAGVWKLRPEALGDCFPEFRPRLDACRFRGCSHLHEPDCAIKAGVEEGTIASSRYESYRALFAEASEDARPG
ncbi:MAG: ribosome small subunit-dependent GTPase A [Gemmatimonadota bacterium]